MRVTAVGLLALWAQAAFTAPAATSAVSTGVTGATGATGATGTQTFTSAQLRQLWATIDVCNATDDPPHTIGIRGSMPGTGDPHEQMYMRFRLQYLDSADGVWVDLGSQANPGFIAVGPAKGSRQGGATFTLKPVAGQALELRGVVTFQWRSGTTVLESLSRPTTAGHKSLAGADPAGFSAASCPLG